MLATVHKKTEVKVQVIGLGYIGLPTSLILASNGISVHGVDVNPKIVDSVMKKQSSIDEPGISDLLSEAVDKGYLTASLEPSIADIHIIAVPTPTNERNEPDLSYVASAVKSIAHVLKKNDLVIIESTIPPLTCSSFVAPIIKELTGLCDQQDYFLAHCPERVIPGRIMQEIVYNDRIVGGTTPQATDLASEMYEIFTKGEILRTDAKTAEMCKLMENTYRDVNIALANELYEICNNLGINPFKAIELSNRHPRVNIHSPGIGVGGHCIPVDPWFIVAADPKNSRIIRKAREINDQVPGEVVEKLLQFVSKTPVKNICFLGITYKENVDDVRESPAAEIVNSFAKRSNIQITVCDPHVIELPKKIIDADSVRHVSLSVAEETDLLVLLVNHSEFDSLIERHPNVLSIHNKFSK